MTVTLTATYDGKVFRPDQPVSLPKNRRFVLTLVEIPDEPQYRESALDVLNKYAGSVDMPADWSEEHDHYLYGTPKRGKKKK